MALHRASDLLLAHQDSIEDHLFARARSLFDFRPTIALCDLTNTFRPAAIPAQGAARAFEGTAQRLPLMFVRAAGCSPAMSPNTGHSRTCSPASALRKARPSSWTAASLRWLRASAYRCPVVSRTTKRVFDSDEARAITTASCDKVAIHKETRHPRGRGRRGIQGVLSAALFRSPGGKGARHHQSFQDTSRRRPEESA